MMVMAIMMAQGQTWTTQQAMVEAATASLRKNYHGHDFDDHHEYIVIFMMMMMTMMMMMMMMIMMITSGADLQKVSIGRRVCNCQLDPSQSVIMIVMTSSSSLSSSLLSS